MAEFAYGPTGHNAHYGAVHNPWNVDHITGGSSSGSGAAVAARLTFAALGSDTGGSIRMPAHFCGVTGLKTTVGRISRAGAMPLSQSLDTVGPLARTAEDCALLLGLMAGADPEDPTASTAGAGLHGRDQRARSKASRSACPPPSMSTISIPKSRGFSTRPSPCSRREGAEIVKVELPDQRQLTAACQLVLAVEAAAFHKRWMIERPQDYGPQVLMRLQNGLAIPGVTYLEAMRWRGPALAAHHRGDRRSRRGDRAGGAGPGSDHRRERCRQQPRRGSRDPAADAIYPPDQLSRPAVAFDPGRLHRSGLPVGMQLIGRSFDEAMLLRIGAAFQRATDFHDRVPKLRMTNLVEIRGLNIRFTGERTVHAVNDLSSRSARARCSACSANPVRARASPCAR